MLGTASGTSDLILLSGLLLLPVLLPTASGTIDSSQTAVSYCRCVVLTLDLISSPLVEQFGSLLLVSLLTVASRLKASMLELLPGLWYYLFFSNLYRSPSQYSSLVDAVGFTAINTVLSIDPT